MQLLGDGVPLLSPNCSHPPTLIEDIKGIFNKKEGRVKKEGLRSDTLTGKHFWLLETEKYSFVGHKS